MSDLVNWTVPAGITLIAQVIHQYYNSSPYFEIQSLLTTQESVDLNVDGANYQPGGKIHWEVIGTVEDSPGAKRLITISTGDSIIGGVLDAPVDLTIDVISCATSNNSLSVVLNYPQQSPDPSGTYTLDWDSEEEQWDILFNRGSGETLTTYSLVATCNDGSYTVVLAIDEQEPPIVSATLTLDSTSGPFTLNLGKD